MIRTVFKVIGLLLIAILLYNYFLGTEQEKEGSEKIFSEIKDVGQAVTDLLKEEKEKFDKGKYDNALQKVNDLFNDLKEKTKELDRDYDTEINQLKNEARELEQKLEEQETKTGEETNSNEIREDLDRLLEKARKLVENIQSAEG